MRSKPSFECYFQELQDSDPAVRAEIEEALDAAATRESTTERSSAFLRETIVLTKGRPVLDFKGGETVIEIAEVESQIWKQRLSDAKSLLAPNIPAVGRIELVNHPR